MAPKPPSNAKTTNKNLKARKSATSGSSAASKSKIGKRPPPKQVKTKPGVHSQTATGTSSSSAAKSSKRKQKTYTDKELNLPALNMITPVGVQKPRGKKKGKVFVDDKESMMTILAMVNAEKEGQIESKMIKARQLEEIREARRREMEKKKEKKQAELEEWRIKECDEAEETSVFCVRRTMVFQFWSLDFIYIGSLPFKQTMLAMACFI
ncbi:60S ribosomal subunit assembly/export protein [Exophiala dermatitidis]|nr:60S ribosomal subunit assembly/export protein [Exophiala dermatitidis]